MKNLIATLVLALGACAAASAGANDTAGVQAAQPAPALQDYAGTYPLAPGFELVIRERDGTLYGQATGQPEFPLQPAGGDGFAHPAIGLEIDFERGADGSVVALELRQSGQVLRGERR